LPSQKLKNHLTIVLKTWHTHPAAGNDAPWYGFNDLRQGDLEFHPNMENLMIELNDTNRLAVMNPPL
jgi:hypothetical protein|tara:strand:+ start:49 stop:249 length:201 start_codon:yes stop_codon:yes gene_type:complete